ncbi:uncharacterized protein [Watersipora subatra]|uniref:uncharacterized protein n=1 Tax=Watersipora subatra TaxID=2589382 RepID=UPI00355AFEC6
MEQEKEQMEQQKEQIEQQMEETRQLMEIVIQSMENKGVATPSFTAFDLNIDMWTDYFLRFKTFTGANFSLMTKPGSTAVGSQSTMVNFAEAANKSSNPQHHQEYETKLEDRPISTPSAQTGEFSGADTNHQRPPTAAPRKPFTEGHTPQQLVLPTSGTMTPAQSSNPHHSAEQPNIVCGEQTTFSHVSKRPAPKMAEKASSSHGQDDNDVSPKYKKTEVDGSSIPYPPDVHQTSLTQTEMQEASPSDIALTDTKNDSQAQVALNTDPTADGAARYVTHINLAGRRLNSPDHPSTMQTSDPTLPRTSTVSSTTSQVTNNSDYELESEFGGSSKLQDDPGPSQRSGDNNQGSGDNNQGSGDDNQDSGDNNQGSGDSNQGSGDNNQGSGDSNQGSGDNNQGSGDNIQDVTENVSKGCLKDSHPIQATGEDGDERPMQSDEGGEPDKEETSTSRKPAKPGNIQI